MKFGRIITHVANGKEVKKEYEESVFVEDRAEILQIVMDAVDKKESVELYIQPGKSVRIVKPLDIK